MLVVVKTILYQIIMIFNYVLNTYVKIRPSKGGICVILSGFEIYTNYVDFSTLQKNAERCCPYVLNGQRALLTVITISNTFDSFFLEFIVSLSNIVLVDLTQDWNP